MTKKKRAALDAGHSVLRSRDLAELADTTPRALRHYHKIGLLPEVPRDPNGYRRYSTRDLVRVLRIRQLSMSGMPLREIAGVLDADAQGQADLLEELDRSLRLQAKRIKAQRKLLSELRASAVQPAWFAGSEPSTATQRFDQDVWSLITATGGIDSDTATTVRDLLQAGSLASEAAVLYSEFEKLERQTHIDHIDAVRMAEQIADFADGVLQGSGFTPVDEELPIMKVVEQMQAESLSPAQHKVWDRFLSIIETRWSQST